MKTLHKILISLGIIILIGILIIIDIADRDIYYSIHIPKKEMTEFHFYQSIEEKKQAYEKKYGNSEWNFPKGKTETIKLYKNKLLISRISAKTLSKRSKKEMINFLNNSENFNWSETTWSLNEAEYILRFYNSENKEIGKVWLCLEGCGMTKSIPFSPNMKFGGISQVGKSRIMEILKLINT